MLFVMLLQIQVLQKAQVMQNPAIFQDQQVMQVVILQEIELRIWLTLFLTSGRW